MTIQGSPIHKAASSAGNALHYRLYLGDAAKAEPTLVKEGPKNVLQIGKGQSLDKAARLAALLHTICPRAHAVAALKAKEQCEGSRATAATQAARALLIAAEGFAGCLWRETISWPGLLGRAVAPTSVQLALSILPKLERLMFGNNWPDGDVSLSRESIDAVSELVALLCAEGNSADLLHASLFKNVPHYVIGKKNSCAPLAGNINCLDIDAEKDVFEETPFSLSSTSPIGSLKDRFRAQIAQRDKFSADLKTSMIRLFEAAPHAPVQEIDVATPKQTGIGIVDTARGRLRHTLVVSDGSIEDWRSDAPTDWNFAPNGPVARACVDLGDPLLAHWIIAAFDPCAPCTVMETTHA